MNYVLLVLTAMLCTSLQLHGQGSSADFYAQSRNTSAVDAKGVRRDGSAYKGAPPWLRDRISGPGPEYPLNERRMRHEGRTIVRLTLDLKTGRTVNASVLRPSGYPALDRAAIAALSRWTWRPGRWNEIDMPVTFRMGNASRPPAPGRIRLPRL